MLLRMLEFRVRCKQENVTVACAISDCRVSTALIHSLNFLMQSFYSSKKHIKENVKFLLSKSMILFPSQTTVQSILTKIRKFKSSTINLGSSR